MRSRVCLNLRFVVVCNFENDFARLQTIVLEDAGRFDLDTFLELGRCHNAAFDYIDFRTLIHLEEHRIVIVGDAVFNK